MSIGIILVLVAALLVVIGLALAVGIEPFVQV
jgi:hypothetical protein